MYQVKLETISLGSLILFSFSLEHPYVWSLLLWYWWATCTLFFERKQIFQTTYSTPLRHVTTTKPMAFYPDVPLELIPNAANHDKSWQSPIQIIFLRGSIWAKWELKTYTKPKVAFYSIIEVGWYPRAIKSQNLQDCNSVYKSKLTHHNWSSLLESWFPNCNLTQCW